MKIIKLIFFIFLALILIAGTAIFIFFQTFDTDQYLPSITQKASLVLGRPVSIRTVGLGFSVQGITLDAGPLTVADDASFTTQPFIKIDRVRISLDLSSLVLRHEVHITHVLLLSPQIHFIRSEEGNFNFQSIKRSNGRGIVSPASNIIQKNPVIPGPPLKHSGGNSAKGVKAPSITIRDAAISFIDQNPAMPLDIWLSNINARLDGFSLSQPFQLSLDASLYSAVPNVHASALVSVDVSQRSVRIGGLKLHTDLSHLDMDRLKYISPGMPDGPVLKDAAGVIQLNMGQLGIGASGDLTANGDIHITGGIIKDFNMIKMILSHAMGGLGGMNGAIDNLLNGRLKNTLGSDDTTIKSAEAQFSIHDKTVFIDDSLVQTNVFEFKTQGSVGQGRDLDMQTMLYLNQDVSAALVEEIGGLKFLMDDSGRIAIGATLRGVFPHLKYKPNKDFRKKSRKALIEEGGNILGVLLGGG